MVHCRETVLIKRRALVSRAQASLGIWGGGASWVSDAGLRHACSGLALNSIALQVKWEVSWCSWQCLRCPESPVQTGGLPPPDLKHLLLLNTNPSSSGEGGYLCAACGCLGGTWVLMLALSLPEKKAKSSGGPCTGVLLQCGGEPPQPQPQPPPRGGNDHQI